MSSQNPFETPLADPQYAHSVTSAGGQIDIGRATSEAWAACWANFPLWLGVMLVGFIINFAAGMTVIGYFIVTPVLVYGQIKFTLNMLEPNKAEFNDLFAGFSRFGAALLPMLGLIAIMFVPMIPMIIGALAQSEVLMGIGGLIMFAAFVVGGPRLGFAFFYAVDREMGVGDALRASWEATRGQWLTVVGLALLATVITMLGYIALIVGVIATAQIAYLMYASGYRQLAGR